MDNDGIRYFAVTDPAKPLKIRFKFADSEFTEEMPVKENKIVFFNAHIFFFYTDGHVDISPGIKEIDY